MSGTTAGSTAGSTEGAPAGAPDRPVYEWVWGEQSYSSEAAIREAIADWCVGELDNRKDPPLHTVEAPDGRRYHIRVSVEFVRDESDGYTGPLEGDEVEVASAPYTVDKVVRVAQVLGQYDADRFDIVDDHGVLRLIHRGKRSGWWTSPRLDDQT